MATYKVIQDIEAEDKFLGPLTLKQFIFGAIGAFFGYLSFFAVSQGAAFLLVIFLPPMLLGFFLAIPWSSEQPTEVWVLAKLRFRFKNQTRIWDQSGLEELVTINVPKKVEKQLTDGLNRDEVESRLKALAETIDSRGWAIKNATLNEGRTIEFPQVGDRLLSPAVLPQAVPEIEVTGYTDVMDDNTTVSNNFNQMIQTSTEQRKQQSLDKMERIRRGEPLETPQQTVSFTPPPNAYMQPAPYVAPTVDEQLLVNELKNKREAGDLAQGNMHTIPTSQPIAIPEPPIADVTVVEEPVKEAQAPVTNQVDPDILELAHNNDLNISTIARQAKRNDEDANEVVISLR